MDLVEMYFVFSLIWSLGASVDENGRKEFDLLIREIYSQMPARDTVYEYYVDHVNKAWKPWEEKVRV